MQVATVAPAPPPAPPTPAPPPPAYGAVPPVPPPAAPLPPAFGGPPPPPTAGYAPMPPPVGYAPMPYGVPGTPGYMAPMIGPGVLSPGVVHGKPVAGPRIIAFLIDAIIIGAISSLISPVWGRLGIAAWFITWFLPAIMLAIYKIVLESQTGQTLGKMLLGLKVVKEDLKPITPSDAQTRSLFTLLYPLVIPIFLDLLSVTEEGQSYGDKWAHTLVVKA